MLRFAALDAAPVIPIHQPTIETLSPADMRAADLDEYDTLIAQYDAALTDRHAADRRVRVIEQQLALVRLSLEGQRPLALAV